jgi:cadmium resistance protein CadD (predicted permease)
MLLGLLLMVSLVVLAAFFGLGHVEEKTSFGLLPILGCICGLAGAFGNWAFGNSGRDDH